MDEKMIIAAFDGDKKCARFTKENSQRISLWNASKCLKRAQSSALTI